MQEFEYEDGKYAVLTANSESDMDEARALVAELKSRLGPNAVILGASVSIKDRYASLTLCDQETKAFVPDSDLVIKDHSSRRYDHNAFTGMITLTTFDFGDKNVREHRKGVLTDFFPNEDTSPEAVFFHFLREKGYDLERLDYGVYFWTDLRDFGAEENEDTDSMPGEEKEPPLRWSLREDFTSPWPINQRITVYGEGGRQVYTRTDQDDTRGREGVCEVYTDFREFMEGPAPDLEFEDTEENRILLLKALDTAESLLRTRRVTDTPETVILETLRKMMPRIKEEDND